MVDCSTGAPLPDYWTALVWATTMGRGVLEATVGAGANTNTSAVRVYAHCTAGAANAKPGSVTVLVINLGSSHTNVSFAGAAAAGATRQFVISPSADANASLTGQAGLMGTGAELNGRPLVLGKGGIVPAIEGATVESPNSVLVPATSVAFFVLDNAEHPACN